MNAFRCFVIAPVLAVLACSNSSAQSGQSVDELRKEVEALKASQAEMQKSLDEIRDFLKAATGGRFGRPGLIDASIDISGAPANGSANAPVTLVEISDYHCPFCRRHVQQTQPTLYSEYVQTGKVRHVFVHYPIEQLHPDAYKSHEAASCAADQRKFWELHAKLFEAPARTNEQLTALAQGAGLDVKAFRTCLESGKHAQAVKESVSRIQQLGVSGTPMFLIGTTPSGSEALKVKKTVEGAQPYSAFKTAIDAVLAQK
jgi:protein-disulfide isomerase